MRHALCIVLFSLLAIPVLAAEAQPVKIDFTVPLLDLDGEALTECADKPGPRDERDCKTQRPVTLGMVAMRALAAPEAGLKQEETLLRGQLAINVYKSASANLTVEEWTLIRSQIGKSFPPVIVARAFELLGVPKPSAR